MNIEVKVKKEENINKNIVLLEKNEENNKLLESKLLKPKNYNDKSFYCLRCKKKFGRLHYFRRHCLGDSPTKRCSNKGIDIDWSVVQHDAKKQLAFYKKNKKYLYNEKPDDDKKLNAIINSNDFTHQLFRYDLEIREDALQIWEAKQKKLGYEILRVKADLQSLRYPAKLTYLIKDKIIYAPYRNNKRYLITVGYVDDIYYEPTCFAVEEKLKEYIERYEINESTPKNNLDFAFIDNFCKIDPKLQIDFDKDQNGWKIDAYDQPELKFKRYVIKEDRSILNSNRCLKAQSKAYGYNLTYYSSTFFESIRKFKTNEYPTNYKIKKHSYTADDAMALIYMKHLDSL